MFCWVVGVLEAEEEKEEGDFELLLEEEDPERATFLTRTAIAISHGRAARGLFKDGQNTPRARHRFAHSSLASLHSQFARSPDADMGVGGKAP